MAHRSVGQLSLADGLVRSGGSRALDRLITAVDWSRFDRVLGGLHASVRGRPSFAPLTMFKCLLLQQWYGLSDPGLEEALADRLSFRRFVGLSLDESVPDHSTLSRFRTRLGEDGLAERLFDDLAAQLSAAGLILREGTLIDATVVQADAVPYSHERAAERSDKDAGFTMTRRGYRLGYKAHVAMDKGSRLIRRAVLTPANQGPVRNFVWGGHNGPDGGSRWHDVKLLTFPTRCWISCWPAPTPRRPSIPAACSTI